MSPRTLPPMLLATLVALAMLVTGGPDGGVALPGLAVREAWALEVVAAFGMLAWVVACALAPPGLRAANDNDARPALRGRVRRRPYRPFIAASSTASNRAGSSTCGE